MNKHDPKIIVALDFNNLDAVKNFIPKLDPALCRVKVGNILFTRYGPTLIGYLHDQGFEIFLDLKYHDIPATVANACLSAAQLGVWMVNMHISGGVTMMQTARKLIDNEGLNAKPLLIGVSILTSSDKNDLIFYRDKPIAEMVCDMALAAKESGLDGMVCSAQEAALLRQTIGDDFILVTPGIRLPGDNTHDQKRVMTPEAALNAGASYLVMGRSITQSQEPTEILKRIPTEPKR